ncbi:zinc finger, CCHC-type containing protein [Tanacetum coccineum]
MIEPKLTTEADTKKDKTAIAYIYQSLPEDQLLLISKYKTAKAVWDALKTRQVRVNRVQQAKQQTLKSEFEMLQMEENESIDSFVTRCKEYGHFANKCPSKKEEQSNLIEEDLEPTLLMATVEEAPGSFINQEESRSKNGRKFHSASNSQYQTLNNKELAAKTWIVV